MNLPRRIAALVLLLLPLLGVTQVLAQSRQDVLLLFDEDNDLPGLATINRSLRLGFEAQLSDRVGFYTESLQLSQFKNDDYDLLLADYFRRKYDNKRVDLVVAVMEPSLDFLLRHRDTLFTNVPIVFCGVDSHDLDGRVLPPDVTGVMMKRNFAPTLETALKLQPETREVFVIGGTSRFDQQIQAIARRDLEPFDGRVTIHWLTALPMDDLVTRVAALPEHSIVYFLTLFTDGRGQSFVTHEALKRITTVANAPVYVSVDQYVGKGAVGGNVYSVHWLGERAAQIGSRILRGEAAAAIPAEALSPYVPMFDWRQLRRWGLDESRLPAGSELEFRTPSVWDQYKWYIVGGVTLFILQSMLLVGMLVNRAQRRRAEQARLESEQRRRLAEEDAQRQRDELAHALRLTTLGELTASIAHELNQPLTAIAANAQAAQQLFNNDRANPDLEEALEDLVSDSIRAAEIIRRLQVLFRKQPAAQVRLDVDALIEEVLQLLASDLRNKQIQVQFSRRSAMARVSGDDVQLRQVILNLLRNAEDAIVLAADGPRELAIATGQADAGHISIDIRDNGVGVKESDLERIFEHFVSSKPQGLGMGLAISRSIVEAHGGRIWATKNPDRGITLHIKLPVAREPETSAMGEPFRGK